MAGAERWRAEMEIGDGVHGNHPTGGIFTKEEFGDCQLHVEWAAPSVVKGDGQGRGNSGVYLQGRYEIQVLDSYQNKTYPNGQAGAFYGHNAAVGQRLPQARRVADLRHHLPCAEEARGRHGAGRLVHRVAQRRADSGPCPGRARAHHGRAASAASSRRARSTCRTTATRCASATSGFARCEAARLVTVGSTASPAR